MDQEQEAVKRDTGPLLTSSRDVQDTGDQEHCCWCPATLKRVLKNDKFCLVLSLFIGQFLSLCLCFTGVFSQMLERWHNVTVPTTQAFFNYALLGIIFGTVLATNKNFLNIFWKNWWKYLILGVIDVEANYMIILAYEYTNLTTIQLLDSFTIACVMVLSFFFLRVRYKLINIMGVCLVAIGIMCLVLATLVGSNNTSGSNQLLGDLLVLGGTALYAISNVAQEFLVKSHSIVEFLGMLGIFASFISGIQLIVLERHELASIDWNADIFLSFFGFALFLFLFYTLVPLVMKISSAVVVNLSLQTADIYSLFFGVYIFQLKFSFFYIVSLLLILTGVFIYNIRQPKTAPSKASSEDQSSTKSKFNWRSLFVSKKSSSDDSQQIQVAPEVSPLAGNPASNTSPLTYSYGTVPGAHNISPAYSINSSTHKSAFDRGSTVKRNASNSADSEKTPRSKRYPYLSSKNDKAKSSEQSSTTPEALNSPESALESQPALNNKEP